MKTIPDTENKRIRILQAGVKVFGRNGLERGKIADVAEEAGIGKGTVYEYFRSKEKLFIAIVDSFFVEIFQYMDTILSTNKTPVHKITALIDYTFDFLDQHLQSEDADSWPIIMEIFTQSMRAEIGDDIHQTLIKELRLLIDVIKPTLQEGIDAGQLRSTSPEYYSIVLFAALDGLALHYYLQRDRLDIKKMKKAAHDLFLNGMLTTTGRKELQL